MTDPDPYTRPRCGGTLGAPALVDRPLGRLIGALRTCPGCPDCAPDTRPRVIIGGLPLTQEKPGQGTAAIGALGLPECSIHGAMNRVSAERDWWRCTMCNIGVECELAPPAPDTQSGGRPTEDETLIEAWQRHFPDGDAADADPFAQRLSWVAGFHAARAESSAALQEARDRAEAAESTIAGLRQQVAASDRELSALSSDKQTLMTAVTHWREQVEGLRAALEGLKTIRWLGKSQISSEAAMAVHELLMQIEGIVDEALTAATRPVPASRVNSEISGDVAAVYEELSAAPGDGAWEWDDLLRIFWRVPGVYGEPRTGISLESYKGAPSRYESWGLTKAVAEYLMRLPGDGALPPDAPTNEEKHDA